MSSCDEYATLGPDAPLCTLRRTMSSTDFWLRSISGAVEAESGLAVAAATLVEGLGEPKGEAMVASRSRPKWGRTWSPLGSVVLGLEGEEERERCSALLAARAARTAADIRGQTRGADPTKSYETDAIQLPSVHRAQLSQRGSSSR